MEIVRTALYSLSFVLDSRYKRHLVGGALLSISMLFAGLALTVMTAKEEDEYE